MTCSWKDPIWAKHHETLFKELGERTTIHLGETVVWIRGSEKLYIGYHGATSVDSRPCEFVTLVSHRKEISTWHYSQLTELRRAVFMQMGYKLEDHEYLDD